MDTQENDITQGRHNGLSPGALDWQYDIDLAPLNRLYELAKAGSWNASADVPWAHWPRSQHFPCTREGNPLCGFTPYEALTEAQQRELSWWQHGLELSEILHGEQAALQISAQLVQLLPDMQAKLFASAQVHDEARHVEFFARYLRETVGHIHPPSPALKALIQRALEETAWDRKLLICQVLIESLALAKFQELRRHCQAPALRYAIDLILRDEARHVRFGTEYLREPCRVNVGTGARHLQPDPAQCHHRSRRFAQHPYKNCTAEEVEPGFHAPPPARIPAAASRPEPRSLPPACSQHAGHRPDDDCLP
jgi:hypothetical protein